eukprot:Gb_29849 [translate_table: standard]
MIRSDPQKILFDGLVAEAAALAHSAQHHNASVYCASFVRLLESFGAHCRDLFPVDSTLVRDGHTFLTKAAALHMGLFRDLEILCLLFHLTHEIMCYLTVAMGSSVIEKDHSSSAVTGGKLHGSTYDEEHVPTKRNMVSAFSILEDDDHAMPRIQSYKFRVSSSCMPNWNSLKKSPSSSRVRLKNEADEAGLEAVRKVAAEGHKIGVDNLRELRLAIRDLKALLSKAAESLESIFFCKSTEFPSFIARAHMRQVFQSFLSFQYSEGPSGLFQHPLLQSEYQQFLCPIGSRIATTTADKITSQLLDSGGPFVVGICGPTGVGKTSIASCVASSCKIKRHFVGGVYWLSVGRKIDLKSLQCCLWNSVSGSQTVFKSADEGRSALARRFSEHLPSLLILDDVWEVSQLEALLCLDGKERGRIIVTTNNSQILPAVDAVIHTLSCLKEEDAIDLFHCVAGWDRPLTSEQMDFATILAKRCEGLPLFIQALASTFYKAEDERKTILQIFSNAEVDFGDERSTVNQSIRNQPPGEECKGPGENTKNSLNGEQKVDRATASSCSLLFSCFSALGIIHPMLQQCFLDLAAFPEGEWVNLSTLEEIWLAFSNGLSQEEIIVVLTILACRSMLDWRLNMFDTCDIRYQIEFKLAEPFYKLASRIVCKEIRGYTKNKLSEVHENSSLPHNKGKGKNGRKASLNCLGGLTNILGFGNASSMRCTEEDMELKSGEVIIDSKDHYARSQLDETKYGSTAIFESEGAIDLRNNSDKPNCNSRFEKEYCLFETGCNMNSLEGDWLDETLFSRATKFSLCSSSVEELPNSLGCPNLRVGLLSGNVRLSFLPSAVLKSMTQLQVLDLRGSVSLTHLPTAISALKSLQMLNLSSCTSLKSLPSSFGHLKNLRCLRICGCTSLTHLPRALGFLNKLEVLQLSGCMKLKSLPSAIGQLSLLKILDLKGCFSLKSLPSSVGLLKELQFVDLSECSNISYTPPYHEQLLLFVIGNLKAGSMAVPTGLWNSGQVEVLRLASLKNFTFLPQSVGRLQHIRQLNLSNCRRLDFLPEEIGNLWLLQELDLSHTAIRKLPDSLGQLRSLLRLRMQGCSRLLSIPSSISSLPKLRCLDMSECWDLVFLPNSIGNSNSLCELEELDLACCSLKSLPSLSWHALPKLKHLKLLGCYVLNTLPHKMELLTSLEKMDLEGCHALTSLKGIGLGKLEKLAWLSIRNCTSLTSLPTEEIVQLKSLTYLDVSGCTGLSPFPQALLTLAQEGNIRLIRWGAVWPQ